MSRIKGSTKRGASLVATDGNIGTTLPEVYGKFSSAKAKAYEYCLKRYSECPNSHDFHIRSCNTWGFTVAWYWYRTPDNPVYTMVTPYNRYDVYLNE